MQKNLLWPILLITLLIAMWTASQRAAASASQASSSSQAPPPPAASSQSQVTTRAYSFNNDVGLSELNDFLTKYPGAKAVAVTVDPKMNRIILVVEIRQ
ncbi:MAG TPA: hypothetical protein VEG30_10590 [Terriglobales bacterium]|nr:hypothetical protein [Terriglobales bacterium]